MRYKNGKSFGIFKYESLQWPWQLEGDVLNENEELFADALINSLWLVEQLLAL